MYCIYRPTVALVARVGASGRELPHLARDAGCVRLAVRVGFSSRTGLALGAAQLAI